eukprot:TRINITY_DN4316_c0_g1_i1.p2 TRINITY_DN4316_c0_g1~~TRINITY_DN4316_c0_g1_i1.p2  ORF type:complete len:415 (-),score=186.11 TRINITY_DN4316_c0_g1_i1:305-1501(-)
MASSRAKPGIARLFFCGSRAFSTDMTKVPIQPISRLSETVINNTGGRSSVSGVVATVFGASGFVSRYLVNRLGRIGSQVIVPYRGDGLEVRHLKLMGDLGQIVPVPFNASQRGTITQALFRSNVVINLMGARRETVNHSFKDVHVDTARLIAECAAEAGVERLIHFSAIGADKDSASDFYRSKAEGEAAVFEAFPRATVLRPAPIFGYEDWLLQRVLSMVTKEQSVPLLRDYAQPMRPIYVGDVAEAVLACVFDSNTRSKIYELAGPELMTDREIVETAYDFFPQFRLKTNRYTLYSESALRSKLWWWQFIPHWRQAFPHDWVDRMKVPLVGGSLDALPIDDLGLQKLHTLREHLQFILGPYLKQAENDSEDSYFDHIPVPLERVTANPLAKRFPERH